MAVETACHSLARFYIQDVIGQRNLNLLDEICLPDIVFCTMTFVGQGITALQHAIKDELTAFPDLTVTLNYLLGDSTRAIARATLRGTFLRPFGKQRPTQRRMVLTTFFNFNVWKDHIADIHVLYDRRTLYEQLGIEMPRVQVWLGR